MLKKILLFSILCHLTGIAKAQTKEREANLEAVFIYNFTKYINWEASAAGNEFVIGVIGPSPVAAALMEIARTNTVDNKKIVVRHFNKPEDIEPCQVLFIPRNTGFPLSSILSRTGKGMLTISEEAGFARQGTALNFVVINDKLRFEANRTAIYSAGLKAGSQLLKLAIIID